MGQALLMKPTVLALDFLPGAVAQNVRHSVGIAAGALFADVDPPPANADKPPSPDTE